MDVLADLLAVSGVRGTVGARLEAGASWGWWAGPCPSAAFHAVTAGTAWLALAGGPPRQLMPGDVVLLPAGTEHTLASDENALARAAKGQSSSCEHTGSGAVSIGSGPVQTYILCANYAHDPAVSTQLLGLLPEVVHLRADNSGGGLDDTVRLLARELAQPQLARDVVLDRLIDILLVQLLRAWLATNPPQAGPSWFGVLNDPLIGEALAKLHADPAHPWTTANLADAIAVSRATLARRFAAAVGETPAAYLARWRIDLAAVRLRDTDDTLQAVASAVGYSSVYAFSRAFSRARHLPPGRYRIAARAGAAAAAA